MADSNSSRKHADPATIRLIVLDVDGVLTDGSIMIDDDGRELKRFNVRDGLGIKTWMQLGFHVAVITRREGGALKHRMAELGVEHVLQGSRDKGAAVEEICRRLETEAAETCFIGDDLPDLAAMARVGYPVAVADAEPAVHAAAAWVTIRPGGHGAVRETIDRLIRARDLMDGVLGQYN